MTASSGWNHVERALARRLLEFMPLIEKWRNESDYEGERLAEACEKFLSKELLDLGRQDETATREGKAAETNKRATQAAVRA